SLVVSANICTSTSSWRYCRSLHSTSINMFFLNDPATTEIYTLSLHDALPICNNRGKCVRGSPGSKSNRTKKRLERVVATPLRSRSEEHTSELSHDQISYAVFCLKKKNKHNDLNSLKLQLGVIDTQLYIDAMPD